MKKLGKLKRTHRGFELIEFKDCYGNPCDLQASSLAEYSKPGISAVWLGLENNRMHLNREQVRLLVAHLSRWLDEGTFDIGKGTP